MSLVVTAVCAARQAHSRHTAQDRDLPILAAYAAPSPKGFAVLLDDIGDPEGLDRWLAELATNLEVQGLSGELRAATPPRVPAWLRNYTTWELTAYVAARVDLGILTADPYASWGAAPDVTAEICTSLADWASVGGSEGIVIRRLFPLAVRDDAAAADMLATAIQATGLAGLYRFERRHQRGRTVYLSQAGRGLLRIHDDQRDWRHKVDGLRDGLIASAASAQLGFIRAGSAVAVDWWDLEVGQGLPGITHGHVLHRPQLLDQYAPDAHGVQILTDAHIDKAHNLSDWNVTDLGNGHHLVEASDLAPWYSQTAPDTDTVAKARHDFGDMLLTHDVTTANPPPWGGPHLLPPDQLRAAITTPRTT